MGCLQERYRLDDTVGRGGMAVVWRGFDLVLKRTVAVKMLPPDLLADPTCLERIRSEALAVARVSHPNIANVYDYGEQRDGGDRLTPFLVMEFVDGETLGARLRAAGPLPWRDAVRVCAAVAEALATAHDEGVVHRDIKPGNVMLSGSGVKVVDFGVAAGIGQDPCDANGLLWGTPAYLPPEQTRGAAAVPAGDVYALGLLLAECLTGRLPEPIPGGPASDGVSGTGLTVPGLPGTVRELLLRCLSADPDVRPTSAEVATALRAAGGLTHIPRPSVGVALRPSAGAAAGARTTAAVDGETEAASRPLGGSGPKRTGPGRTSPRRRRLRSALLFTGPATILGAVLASQLAGAIAPGGVADGEAAHPDRQPTGCVTHYTAREGLDGTFTVDLTVTNTGQWRLDNWSMEFALPPGQRVVDVQGAVWEQDRRTVTLAVDDGLAPGGTVTTWLRGVVETGGRDAPRQFTVNGVTCERAVTQVRSSVAPADPTPPLPVAGGPGGGGASLDRPPTDTTSAAEAPSDPGGSAAPSDQPGPEPTDTTPPPATATPSAQPTPSATATPPATGTPPATVTPSATGTPPATVTPSATGTSAASTSQISTGSDQPAVLGR